MQDFIKFSENILNDVELSNEYLDCIFFDSDIGKIESSSNALSDSKITYNTGSLQTTDNNVSRLPGIHTQSASFHSTSDLMEPLELDEFNDSMHSIEFGSRPMFANDKHISARTINVTMKSPMADTQRSTKMYERKVLMKRKLTTKQRQPKILRPVIEVVTGNETYSNTINFENWLSSIVERINLTMDFNCNGTPDKLIFSVPNVRKNYF